MYLANIGRGFNPCQTSDQSGTNKTKIFSLGLPKFFNRPLAPSYDFNPVKNIKIRSNITITATNSIKKFLAQIGASKRTTLYLASIQRSVDSVFNITVR